MSVICHNFVQNAWKKELCSNCFKSVGEHENVEESPVNGCNGAAAHTTWKSLITERSQKNSSQLFKLENGFQGKLLTINKASERKGHELNGGHSSNGHHRESLTKSSITFASNGCRSFAKSVSSRESNGHPSVPESSECHSLPNGISALESDVSKIPLNGVRNRLNEFESKNGFHISKNGGLESCLKSAFLESTLKNRERPAPQGILKKTVPKTAPQRRESNVGFKDEEPLVIGYGGRDFSPEELEWEMNCSDGDIETGSDSFDETEDDKAFSQMTRQNTEFNSDNSNLLHQHTKHDSFEKENLVEETINGSNEKETVKTISVKNKYQQNGYIPNEIRTHGVPSNGIHEKTTCSDSSSEQVFKSLNEHESATTLEVKNVEARPGKNIKELISVAIKNSESVLSCAGAKKRCAPSGEEARNNLEEEEKKDSVGNGERSDDIETNHSSEMFSEELPKGEEDPGKEEWTLDQEDLAGDLLQAINTSLANRHKVNNERDIENDSLSQTANSSSKINGEVRCLEPPNGNVTVNDDPSKQDDKMLDTAAHVEARPSFLHGRVSSCKAIYGPASDLFVSRSNSSSSSSSDECHKTEVSHSISVTVNGQNAHKPVTRSASVELLNISVKPAYTLTDYETDSSVSSKFKPRIPEKPLSKRSSCAPVVQTDSERYAKPTADVKYFKLDRRKSEGSVTQNNSYYCVSNSACCSDGPKSMTLVDHYAESNIYHEVMLDDEEKLADVDDKQCPKRESKLAALAMELEQVRHSNNSTKRQAPAPPKIPEPPSEDPPSSSGRVSPAQIESALSTLRGGDAAPFSSSSSSAASTSSQDTETGYASWNVHGDLDEKRKHSKSKSSFLLTQYSKCKMLAMSYADEGAKSRKKFSIKKLLKIRKEGGLDNNTAFDPHCPNPKAWKYSDHFERPRAKLEIIHPMDLENRSVTVNPGFDSFHSLSSFGATSADDLSSLWNPSVSSDYGSFYSDAISPTHDIKPEANYESIPNSRLQNAEGQQQQDAESKNSPTPSRSSNASTLTCDSSKNGGRPPKPPPPPRAHSLLHRAPHNADGTYKFPVGEGPSTSEEAKAKPQAPKRQCKASPPPPDSGIYDNTLTVPNISDQFDKQERIPDPPQFSQKETSLEMGRENAHLQENSSESKCADDTQPCSRRHPPPLTKAPSRPPPIYMKPQLGGAIRNAPHPWTSLEDSYALLTASNRDLLLKLVHQSVKKRKSFMSKLQIGEFKWSDFEIDLKQPTSVFAFGEKIAYHATMPHNPDYLITLVVTVQQIENRISENNEWKYPVFGQFIDTIPRELVDGCEWESMHATVLVVDRSNISTIECFSDHLPDPLTDPYEKELSFILLQLIHSLKSLQAQGIESIDSSFQHLILAKTKSDKYNTLIFLSDSCFDESDYVSESCRVSLCQYALMVLLQLLGLSTAQHPLPTTKFSSEIARRTFELAIDLLSEEKAVSLSQTKTLMECFLWELAKVVLDDPEDTDIVLQRWMDVKRSNFIKNIVNDEGLCDINTQDEYYSQFLIRTSIRNVREILSSL